MVLQITFRSSKGAKERTYNYAHVPSDVVDEFLAAASHGAFVNERIKPHYHPEEVT